MTYSRGNFTTMGFWHIRIRFSRARRGIQPCAKGVEIVNGGLLKELIRLLLRHLFIWSEMKDDIHILMENVFGMIKQRWAEIDALKVQKHIIQVALRKHTFIVHNVCVRYKTDEIVATTRQVIWISSQSNGWLCNSWPTRVSLLNFSLPTLHQYVWCASSGPV